MQFDFQNPPTLYVTIRSNPSSFIDANGWKWSLWHFENSHWPKLSPSIKAQTVTGNSFAYYRVVVLVEFESPPRLYDPLSPHFEPVCWTIKWVIKPLCRRRSEYVKFYGEQNKKNKKKNEGKPRGKHGPDIKRKRCFEKSPERSYIFPVQKKIKRYT